MFRRLDQDEIKSFTPEWNIICAPGFMADPKIDGTRQKKIYNY
jgi:phosphoenolpyruvate carboxykinase (ATP)